MPTYAQLVHVAVLAVLVNLAGMPTLFFQTVFSLESARSCNSMSVGACAPVDILLGKYFEVHQRKDIRIL